MDPNCLEEALEKYGDKVKAVVPVHLYGISADMDKIIELCSFPTTRNAFRRSVSGRPKPAMMHRIISIARLATITA